jgi:predicted small lipoprotein YifL
MMRPRPEYRLVSSLPPRLVRALILGAILVVPLSACGRKGPLEPPPGSVAAKSDPLAVPETDDEEGYAVKTLAPVISPVTGKGSRGRGKPITAPKDSFVLDPIL